MNALQAHSSSRQDSQRKQMGIHTQETDNICSWCDLVVVVLLVAFVVLIVGIVVFVVVHRSDGQSDGRSDGRTDGRTVGGTVGGRSGRVRNLNALLVRPWICSGALDL